MAKLQSIQVEVLIGFDFARIPACCTEIRQMEMPETITQNGLGTAAFVTLIVPEREKPLIIKSSSESRKNRFVESIGALGIQLD